MLNHAAKFTFLKTVIVFLLLSTSQIAFTQETILSISSSMFDEDNRIPISSMEGWSYRQGADLSWARDSIELDNWSELIPDSINTSMVDANGKLEAWFRAKIRIDSTFNEIPFGLSAGRWAAMDVFLDGELYHSFGSTGLDGKRFKEYNPVNKRSISITLSPNKTHTISLYVVDLLFDNAFAKMQQNGVKIISKSGVTTNVTPFHTIPVISLVGSEFDEFVDVKVTGDGNRKVFITMFLTISFLLVLMLIQSTGDTTLRWITLSTLIFSMPSIMATVVFDRVSSFQKVFIYDSLFSVFWFISFIILLPLIAKILKGRIQKTLKIFLIILGVNSFLFVSGLGNHLFRLS